MHEFVRKLVADRKVVSLHVHEDHARGIVSVSGLLPSKHFPTHLDARHYLHSALEGRNLRIESIAGAQEERVVGHEFTVSTPRFKNPEAFRRLLRKVNKVASGRGSKQKIVSRSYVVLYPHG
jgi:cobyrinic acid a,c-diamide synthase